MSAIDEIDTLINMMVDRWESEHPGIERPNVDTVTNWVLMRISDADVFAVLETLMQRRVHDYVWDMGI